MIPRLALRLSVLGLLALAGCAHEAGEKGGLVSVKASSDEVSQAFEARRFATVVGISEIGDSSWRALRYARKDAIDVAASLRDPALGRFAHVDVLTSSADTTREGVLRAARELAAESTRADDIVFFYVSAHGTLARDNKGVLKRYLVTSDARMADVPGTALEMDELQAALDGAASRRRVVVLATCHSGSGKSLLPREVERELASIKAGGFERPLEEASRARVVLSASDWGETAREDDRLQNDIYTHFLVEGLGGVADRNADGAVTATEAHDYARRRTWAFSGGRQRPSAELLEVGADPIVLSGSIRRQGAPELYSYAPRLDGFTVRVDGEPRGELPGGFALKEGAHHVSLEKGGAVLMADDMRLAVGERIDLEAFAARAEPWRTVSLTGGLLGFVDQKSRTELFPSTAALGASVRLDRVASHRLSAAFDVSGFQGDQKLVLPGQQAVPFTATVVVGGASLLYTWDWRSFSFFAGPRVAALWVQRSFTLEAYRKSQSALSVTPGATAGAAWHLSRDWEVSAGTQAMVTLVAVDGQTQVLGFAGGWAAVGYRF